MSNPLPALEYKAAPTEIKAVAGADGEYEGYFSTWTPDDGGDVIEPGAFTKTLQERGPSSGKNRIKVCWFHRSGLDGQTPIIVGAPPTVLQEDSTGLYAKGQLVLGTQAGRETWELIKAGAITEASIGYSAVPARTRFQQGTRYLGEVKLYELSFVPLGMNPATHVSAVKALKAMWDSGCAPDPYETMYLLTRLLDYVQDGNMLTGVPLDDLTNAAELLDQAQQVVAALCAMQMAAMAPGGSGMAMDALTLPTMASAAPAFLPLLKEGRMFSAASLEKIKAAITALQALLDAATPSEKAHLAPIAAPNWKALDTRLALLRAHGYR